MGKYGLTLRKVPYGVYPIFAFVGAGIGGAGYFISHALFNPDNVFDKKNNPTPYESVKQYQTTKFYNPSGYFKEKWSRERL
jgi:NADH dehydrogenase (ubiquinone) 1 alpha subcomplex subunit 4